MRELVLRFGKITEQSYEKLLHNLEKHPPDYLHNLLFWLIALKQNEYEIIRRIYKMPPKQECWNNYIIFGVSNLREQHLMDHAGNKFRDAWRKRPIYVKKKSTKPNNDQTDLAGGSVRSEESGPIENTS